ncbi:MAG: hypothetical protein Q9222_003057 [Ikaeria aurantiellina]
MPTKMPSNVPTKVVTANPVASTKVADTPTKGVLNDSSPLPKGTIYINLRYLSIKPPKKIKCNHGWAEPEEEEEEQGEECNVMSKSVKDEKEKVEFEGNGEKDDVPTGKRKTQRYDKKQARRLRLARGEAKREER